MWPSTVQERGRFYRNEFELGRAEKLFDHWTSPVVFGVVIGRHTRIYPPEHKDKYRDTILIDEYKGYRDVVERILEFLPESVYYDRNVYASWKDARAHHDIAQLGRRFGQELAFDVDPENFDCPIHGSLEEKMDRHQGLSFCRFELQSARIQALELYELLSTKFSAVRLVYSGRGFHLHVLDEHAIWWTRKKRLSFVTNLMRKGFVVDEWVTAGGMRMIRLPYSLNGLVSRTALPLKPTEMESFDPLTDPRVIPRFLQRAS